MGNRHSSPLRHALLAVVIHLDGDICLLCLKTDFKPRERTLDHVDNNKRNDDINNLCLLCRGCNAGEGNRHRHGIVRLITTENILGYRKRAAEKLGKPNLRGDLKNNLGSRVPSVCVSGGEEAGTGRKRIGWESAESGANLIMEPNYRDWLYSHVKRHTGISKSDAIDGGAEFVHRKVGRASQKAITRYFQKAISCAGWLEERAGKHGEAIWVFRTDWTLEQWQALEKEISDQLKPLDELK